MSGAPEESTNPTAFYAVAGALVVATLLHAGIGIALVRTGIIPRQGLSELSREAVRLLEAVFTVLGLLLTAASFAVRRLLAVRLPEDGGGAQARFQAVLIPMVLAESVGVLGLVHVLLTGGLTFACILWGIALFACISHFPTRGVAYTDIAAKRTRKGFGWLNCPA